MENIENNNVYLERMMKTFVDKAFFLKYIPENITTIVDYGCSDGSFLDFIRNICGNRYNYIGIEKNKDFSILAEEKGFKVLPDDSEIISMEDSLQKNTCVVMSSVLHEIFSYCGEKYARSLMKSISLSNFGAVAIRDMSVTFKEGYDTKNISDGMIEFLNQAIINHNEKFHDFVSKYGVHYIKDMFHFLLKYMYDENWNRELNENYLWKYNSLENYTNNVFVSDKGWKSIGETFQIPYLKNKWQQDFNKNNNKYLKDLIENTYTHFKVIFLKG